MAIVDSAVHDAAEPAGYPREWEFDGLLRNGEAVVVRPIRPADAPALVGLHGAVSPGTLHRHVLLTGRTLSLETAAGFSEVDYDAQMAFVALVSDELVALASYDRLDAPVPTAEASFMLADAYQGQGVTTLLFESLSEYGRARGILRFIAEVKAQNTALLEIFAATGLRCTRRGGTETVRVEIDLRPTAAYRASCDRREAIAEVASVAAVLRPRSIAVVGAGRRPENVGHQVVRSLLVGDFSGTVYPVNPAARAVCGVPAFPALLSIPEPVDLAVVAVPAAAVPGVIDEAASVGVRAVTIITAGFGETGRSGAAVETELLSVARRHGMRIVGPNCLGVMNTDPAVRMNATFASLDPLPGHLALVSQSGAVGIVLSEQTRAVGLGLSAFVSVGNKLDVSPNDLLCFFEDDERTSVVALYLESLGNPRKFARIARRVGAVKPIVALKAGRTSAGARGARSHTAAAATPEVTVAALLRSAGVIKVDRLEELLDVSAILLASPLPGGRRVALVGNSGGPLILTADACEGGELTVPELGQATRNALGEVLAAAAATANPVDLTADGTAAMLERALDIVLADDAVDAVITVVVETMAISAAAARHVIDRVAQRAGKPVVACSVEVAAPSGPSGAARVAEIPSPERAAVALGRVCGYAQWRRRAMLPAREPEEPSDHPVIREIVDSKLAGSPGGGWLELDQATRLLTACGLPVLPAVARGERGRGGRGRRGRRVPRGVEGPGWRSGAQVGRGRRRAGTERPRGCARGIPDDGGAARRTDGRCGGPADGGAGCRGDRRPGHRSGVRAGRDGRPRRDHDRPAPGSRIRRPAARAWRGRRHGGVAPGRAAAGRLPGGAESRPPGAGDGDRDGRPGGRGDSGTCRARPQPDPGRSQRGARRGL